MRFEEIMYAHWFKPLFGLWLDDCSVVYIPGINFVDSTHSNLRAFRKRGNKEKIHCRKVKSNAVSVLSKKSHFMTTAVLFRGSIIEGHKFRKPP